MQNFAKASTGEDQQSDCRDSERIDLGHPQSSAKPSEFFAG
jgi:hypothetical protein